MGSTLGGTSAMLKSSGITKLDKNAVYFRIQNSTDWNNWPMQNSPYYRKSVYKKILALFHKK